MQPETKVEATLKLPPIVTKAKVSPQPTIDMNKTISTPHVNNEEDKLIQEELNRQQLNNDEQDDGIYEGGEEDEKEQNSAVKRGLGDFDKELEEENKDDDDQSSDEELDPEDENNPEKRMKRRLREVYDWRSDHSPFSAFWLGKLRPNDYQIIVSLLVAHLAVGALALAVSVDTDSVLGVTIAVPLVHYSMAAFSIAKILNTDSPMSPAEYFFFFLAYGLQYAWGIANLFVSYSAADRHNSGAVAGTYIVVYLMVIPFITSVLSAAGKWLDDKGQFSPFLVVQLVLAGLQGVGMLVLAFVFMTYAQGVTVAVVIAVAGYLVFQVYLYVKNDYELPTAWAAVNVAIIACVMVVAIVLSFFLPGFSNFIGVSIAVWLLAAMFLVFALSEISSDLKNMETKPVFFSPWIFPVYNYNLKKNDVTANNGPAVALIVGFLVLIMWAAVASVWIDPHNVGVCLSILFMHVLIIICYHIAQASGL